MKQFVQMIFFTLLFKISVDVMNNINPFPIIYFFTCVSHSFLNKRRDELKKKKLLTSEDYQ